MNWMEQELMVYRATGIFVQDRLYEMHVGGGVCMDKCYDTALLQSAAEDDLLSHDAKERAKAERAKECATLCLLQFGKTYTKAKAKFEGFVKADPLLHAELVGADVPFPP